MHAHTSHTQAHTTHAHHKSTTPRHARTHTSHTHAHTRHTRTHTRHTCTHTSHTHTHVTHARTHTRSATWCVVVWQIEGDHLHTILTAGVTAHVRHQRPLLSGPISTATPPHGLYRNFRSALTTVQLITLQPQSLISVLSAFVPAQVEPQSTRLSCVAILCGVCCSVVVFL